MTQSGSMVGKEGVCSTMWTEDSRQAESFKSADAAGTLAPWQGLKLFIFQREG